MKTKDIALLNETLILNIASDKSFKHKIKRSINQMVKDKPKDFRRVDLSVNLEVPIDTALEPNSKEFIDRLKVECSRLLSQLIKDGELSVNYQIQNKFSDLKIGKFKYDGNFTLDGHLYSNHFEKIKK
tara:strand:- start:416 stop:799 length:384 start_codon:yes stop_codon:yes gene_type:complete